MVKRSQFTPDQTLSAQIEDVDDLINSLNYITHFTTKHSAETKITAAIKSKLLLLLITFRKYKSESPDLKQYWNLLIRLMSATFDYMARRESSWSLRLSLLNIIKDFVEESVDTEEDNYVYCLENLQTEWPGHILTKMIHETYIVQLIKLYTNIQIDYNADRIANILTDGYDSSDDKLYPPFSINFNDELDQAVVRNVPEGFKLKDFMDNVLRRTVYD